jgi:hypothetical protein
MGYSERSGCMRLKFAALVLMAIPAVAVAQSPAPGPKSFPALPQIGLPLAPIGLPLPPIGLPPVTDSRHGGQPRGIETQHLGLGSRRPFRSRPTVVYFVPTVGWGYPFGPQSTVLGASVPGTATPDRRYERFTGTVRLDVQPAGMLQFYVDGYYVGTANDFNGELELEAGPHTIEIRAPGYETLTFDVKIAAQRLITYRGALTPIQPPADQPVREPDPPQADAPAAPPTTIYFIPGCYLGNVPPEKVALPADCDLSKLITRKP